MGCQSKGKVMAKMADFLISVEELYDAGLSIEQIAERLKVPVPLIEDAFKWMTNHSFPQDQEE
jgi:orotate phosphoribosyltransferase-like protein